MKDGFPVEETNRVRVTAEGSLVFEEVNVDDAGDYTCVAKNVAGTQYSDTASLFVVGQYLTLCFHSL